MNFSFTHVSSIVWISFLHSFSNLPHSNWIHYTCQMTGKNIWNIFNKHKSPQFISMKWSLTQPIVTWGLPIQSDAHLFEAKKTRYVSELLRLSPEAGGWSDYSSSSLSHFSALLIEIGMLINYFVREIANPNMQFVMCVIFIQIWYLTLISSIKFAFFRRTKLASFESLKAISRFYLSKV